MAYEWPGKHKPMRHQVETVKFLAKNNRCFCLDGLGTGKTLSAIWASDFLIKHERIHTVLVVAPLSICDWVWERELFQTVPHRSMVRLNGDRRTKQRIVKNARHNYIIVNPESLDIIREYTREIDLVLVDEFTKFKNHKSKRWKALNRIAKDKMLWMLSGTPAPQGPLDAYGPIKLVNPEAPSFLRFRSLTMEQITRFVWYPKPGSEEVVAQYMQPAIRHTRAECYDLPEVSTEPYEYQLTKAQQQAINQFQAEAVAEIDEYQIPATTAAAVLSKCLQTMAGGIYYEDEEGKHVKEVNAKPYYEAIQSICEQADTPVLYFCPFRSQVDATAKALEKAGFKVECITGDTKNRDRGRIFDAIQAGRLDAVVAVARTMSHGLTLTNARYVVWASPPYSFEEYEQANGRVVRKGQSRKVTIYHLVCNDMSKRLFRRLRTREKLQKTLLEILQKGLTEVKE